MDVSTFIEWTNSNQGFGLVTLTGIYVVATVAIVLVTYRSNSLMKHHIQLIRDIEKERSRPAVLFHLEFAKREGQIVDAVFHNTGLTPAYDISVDIRPEIRRFWSGGIKDSSPTSLMISFLPPGEKLIDSLGLIHAFHQKYNPPIFSGEIRYKDSSGVEYVEKINLDYSYRKNTGIAQIRGKDVGKQLENIAKAIGDLGKS